MTVRRLLVLGLAALTALVTGCSSAGSPGSAAAPLQVDTTSGRLQGLSTVTARQFLGVRYAEAPTGPRRWTLPVAPPHRRAPQAQAVGCTGPDTVGCLRGKPVTDLLPIAPSFANMLAFGTPMLPVDPARAVRDGATPTIPILSGGNQAEARAFVGGMLKIQPFVTPETYPALLRNAFADQADAVAAHYPLSAYPNAATAWSAVITDSSWACPTLAGNAAMARGGATVHGYEFADPTAPDVNQAGSPDFDPGPAHATDVGYLFDLTGRSLLHTPQQQRLAEAMVSYWTSFARTGTPAAPGAPAWPALTGTDGPSLQLAPTIAPVDVAAEHRCGFWASVRG